MILSFFSLGSRPSKKCEKVAPHHTVALTEFASKSLLVKVHLKKNPEAEKLDGNRYQIKFPIDYRRVFLIAVFFGVHFYRQTQGTDLHHTVLLVGVTDSGISGACLG
jgi:hypothetical protein